MLRAASATRLSGLVRSTAVVGLAGLALGCSNRTGPPVDASASASAIEPSPNPDPEEQPVRVLVTGFNDWRELGDPPNLWRCRDNPSCRLLLGDPHDAAPTAHAGPLVTRLEAQLPEVEWRFATLPVTWGAFAEVPDDVDVIINVGLGVYDRFDALQLEAGAYNLRAGADAAAAERPGPIQPDAELVLPAPPASPISARLAALAGQQIAGFEILVADAREANSYLCNETHFHALSALIRGHGRLREVYFLHVPYAEAGDYEALADGVAGVVVGLLGR